MVRAVAENVAGDNIVTTALEHPSSYDAAALYAKRLGKELRVAPGNAETGGIDTEAIVGLIDERTCLLVVIYASNISGGIQGVTVLLDHDDLQRRDLILAIGLAGIDHSRAVREYEKRGVIVYERVNSSIYSKRMLESFALDGAVRVSPLHCHTFDDVDRFLDVTREICAVAAA